MIKEHRDNESKGMLSSSLIGGDLLYTLLEAQDEEAAIGLMAVLT